MTSNVNKNDTISEKLDGERQFNSGATSPEEGRSLFSGRGRSNTETTLVSSVAETTDSVSTTQHPGPPVNSPMNSSVAGDAGVDMTAVMDRVKTITPPGIVRSGEMGSVGDLTEGIKRAGVMEGSVWENEAVADAAIGLKRLVQLARDENARDPSKSIEEYYSEHLSKVIKEAEIKFDAMKLE